MISPGHFNQTSYEDLIREIEDKSFCGSLKFDVFLYRVSEDTLEATTSERKPTGRIVEVNMNTSFAITVESIQIAIMTVLAYQEGKGCFEGFRVVSETHPRILADRIETLQQAVNLLADHRKSHPDEAIYLVPVFRDRRILRSLAKKFFL